MWAPTTAQVCATDPLTPAAPAAPKGGGRLRRRDRRSWPAVQAPFPAPCIGGFRASATPAAISTSTTLAQLPSFNDDTRHPAGVATGRVLAASAEPGWLEDHRIVVFRGPGQTAGCGSRRGRWWACPARWPLQRQQARPASLDASIASRGLAGGRAQLDQAMAAPLARSDRPSRTASAGTSGTGLGTAWRWCVRCTPRADRHSSRWPSLDQVCG